VSGRAEKPITGQERDLLAAIVALVGLPHPASHEERQEYYEALSMRAAWLCGALDDAMADPGLQLGAVTETCRHFAARPLGYEAKSAGKPATTSLADSPGLRQLLEAQGITRADEAGLEAGQ
jgi:hypothetical protein